MKKLAKKITKQMQIIYLTTPQTKANAKIADSVNYNQFLFEEIQSEKQQIKANSKSHNNRFCLVPKDLMEYKKPYESLHHSSA